MFKIAHFTVSVGIREFRDFVFDYFGDLGTQLMMINPWLKPWTFLEN